MKILLLGKNGMLGSQFDKLLDGFELFSFGHEDLDVTDYRSLEKFFGDISPDVVINCTGYTDVDGAENNKGEAFELNAETPKNLAKLCDKYGAVLIHFSTDYVFDGRKTPPDGYDEKCVPNPLNVYGESKFLGEEAVIGGTKKFYIIRTSWLYGKNGKNFIDTMLRLGKEVVSGERDGLKVVNDQFGSPTYTYDLAKAVVDNFVVGHEVCSRVDGSGSVGVGIPAKRGSLPFGIYHLTNDGFTNWHEFAVRIFELVGIKVEVASISSREYPCDANRPKNSILINKKLEKSRRWDDALKEYLTNY